MIKSRIVYVILLGLLLLLGFTYYPKHTLGGGEATISWDVSGYYWYLPAAFIYHDLRGLSFSDSLRDAYGCSPDNQQITILPDGKKVLKYSSGMALQYLPFFLLAHTLAPHLGYPADGLSPPYQYAVFLGALVMMSIGLWYLQKVLLRYFQDKTVALLLICVTLGTNYLDYTTIDVGMTHAWLFAWYALLLYQCDTFYQSPHWKRAIGIGCIS